MTIDRRYLLEENVEDVRNEVVSILDQLKLTRPKFDYSLRELWSVEPTMTDRDAPVVRAVADAIRDEFGKEPDYVISPGTYDQKHIARIGHLHDCIAYGPGVIDLAHQPDEWIGIEDMVQSAKVMANAVHVLLSHKL
jgi:succinyl-diaminopimelate desuccinylase